MQRLPFLLAVVLTASQTFAADSGRYGANPPDLEKHLQRMVDAYPSVVQGFDDKSLILKDGRRLALSDGNEAKTFDQMLDSPDIGDMFSQPYPAGAPASAPARNFDPGRIRYEPLFAALYGDCAKGSVSTKLRRIDWVPGHGGGKVPVTTAQGADKALEAVSRDLDRLPKEFGKYLVPSAGTYNCRPIAGTTRKSAHGYGIAIDINTEYSAYWRWSKPGADGAPKWQNRIPMEIVSVFENHGFVWGGRWSHFDTMHFEYRPDLSRELGK